MPTGLSGTRLPARRAHATASARGRHIRDASDRQPGVGWSSRLTRRRWAAAGATVAVLALGGAATIVMLPQPAGKAPARVAFCGLVACDVLPSATAAARATAWTVDKPSSLGQGIFMPVTQTWRVRGESLRLAGPPERTPVLARCYTYQLGEVMPKVRGAAEPAGFRDLFY